MLLGRQNRAPQTLNDHDVNKFEKKEENTKNERALETLKSNKGEKLTALPRCSCYCWL